MVKAVRFMFRLSEPEYERLKSNAKARGFSTIAGFLRSVSLDRDLWIEQKVQEIYLMLKEIKN